MEKRYNRLNRPVIEATRRRPNLQAFVDKPDHSYADIELVDIKAEYLGKELKKLPVDKINEFTEAFKKDFKFGKKDDTH